MELQFHPEPAPGEFLEQLHENDSVGLFYSSVNRAGIDWHIYALNTRREYILQVFFCVLFSNLFSVTNRKGFFFTDFLPTYNHFISQSCKLFNKEISRELCCVS